MQDGALMVAAKQLCDAAGELSAIRSIEDKIKRLDANMPQIINGKAMLIRASKWRIFDLLAGSSRAT